MNDPFELRANTQTDLNKLDSAQKEPLMRLEIYNINNLILAYETNLWRNDSPPNDHSLTEEIICIRDIFLS